MRAEREHVGSAVGEVHGSVHTKSYNHIASTQKTAKVLPVEVEEWHTYAVDWSASRIQFMIDDMVYFTFDNDQAGNSDTWPFDAQFFLILNVAVGGMWGGPVVDEAAFQGNGQIMEVEYVRMYQHKPTAGGLCKAETCPGGYVDLASKEHVVCLGVNCSVAAECCERPMRCSADCTLPGSGTVSCLNRVKWVIANYGDSACDGVARVSADCAGQCSCTTQDVGGAACPLQEPPPPPPPQEAPGDTHSEEQGEGSAKTRDDENGGADAKEGERETAGGGGLAADAGDVGSGGQSGAANQMHVGSVVYWTALVLILTAAAAAV